ncbi:MAG: DUF378 domain-containing protein [Clostridia bacterium]|nr:DUF378 domain-containing protein [Clostridia bacterium]
MLKIIAFILTILGGINWLAIGMLQYDFVAGIFGTQANLFSRIVYTLVGISAIYLTCVIIANKGKLTNTNKRSKKAEQD